MESPGLWVFEQKAISKFNQKVRSKYHRIEFSKKEIKISSCIAILKKKKNKRNTHNKLWHCKFWAFWDCPRAHEVWAYSGIFPTSGSQHFQWYMVMVEYFEEDSVAFIVMAVWAIRTNRNEIRHGGKKKSRLELIHWCGHYLDEYHTAQVVPTKPSWEVEFNWSPPYSSFLYN